MNIKRAVRLTSTWPVGMLCQVTRSVIVLRHARRSCSYAVTLTAARRKPAPSCALVHGPQSCWLERTASTALQAGGFTASGSALLPWARAARPCACSELAPSVRGDIDPIISSRQRCRANWRQPPRGGPAAGGASGRESWIAAPPGPGTQQRLRLALASSAIAGA